MGNEFYSQAAADASKDLDEFTKGYIMCLYFTDTGDSDEQPDSEADLSPEALTQCIDDCKDFQIAFKELLEKAYEATGNNESLAGNDFWLTRNGHGAGFWDGNWGDYGNKLTALSTPFGTCDVYEGDDEKIYVS